MSEEDSMGLGVGPSDAEARSEVSDSHDSALAPEHDVVGAGEPEMPANDDGGSGEAVGSVGAAGESEVQSRQKKRDLFNSVMRTILLALLAFAVGVGIGILVYPRIPFPGTAAALPGKVVVSEDELDTPLGTYTYQGHETPVTVREAIEESTTLEAVRNADGMYEIPSVDAVISIARNQILMQDAEAHGIEATDEDAVTYAEQTLGTSDYSVIASNYSMSEDQVRALMKRSATLKLLRDEVVTTEPLSEPTAPAAPEAGMEDEPMAEYASYITDLVGDEWDVNANAWARQDGPFHEQLRDYTISNDAATYSAAQVAYYVAYTQYSTVQQQISTEWTTYVNEMLSEVTVELGTLVA